LLKRTTDVALSAIGLVISAPIAAVIAVAIKLDSGGPVIFRQERVGRGFRPFLIYKFRTMVADAPRIGRAITVGGDRRITRVGRFLRRTKLDELPQLINVLKGDMSLVGPRPELRKYVEAFRAEYERILTVRPGMTDLASLRFIDESSVLARAGDPERAYVEWVLPEKIKLARQYVDNSSLRMDLHLLGLTLARIISH